MDKIKVRVLSAPTPEQLATVTGAARMTMVRGALPDERPFDPKMLRRLVALGHGSPLEQADLQVSIEGASRVFLAQITRHRHVSFTSASQQYQLHHGFDYLVPPLDDPVLELGYHALMEQADRMYREIEARAGRDWARYVLPGACRNTLLMKANLREWFGTIVPQRACRRNTPETVKVVAEVLKGAVEHGLGDFVVCSGPACLVSGGCDQGKLCCGRPMRSWEEMLCP